MPQACLERYIDEDIQTQTTSKYAFNLNLIEANNSYFYIA